MSRYRWRTHAHSNRGTLRPGEYWDWPHRDNSRDFNVRLIWKWTGTSSEMAESSKSDNCFLIVFLKKMEYIFTFYIFLMMTARHSKHRLFSIVWCGSKFKIKNCLHMLWTFYTSTISHSPSHENLQSAGAIGAVTLTVHITFRANLLRWMCSTFSTFLFYLV
jgi:hypothetical protein